MSRYTKMKCHFKGCSGEVDVVEEMKMAIWYYEGKPPKVVDLPWCIHTIICPKCRNAVGHISLGPSTWVTLPSGKTKDGKQVKMTPEERDKHAKHFIHNPRNKKGIEVAKEKESMDPYLKKWARLRDEEEDTQ